MCSATTHIYMEYSLISSPCNSPTYEPPQKKAQPDVGKGSYASDPPPPQPIVPSTNKD